MSQFIQRILNNLAFRMVMAATIVSVPLGLSVVWLGSAYASLVNGRSFLQNALEVAIPAVTVIMVIVLGLAYPVERWVIHGRAVESAGWLGARLATYTLVGAIGGAIMRYATALVGHESPGLVQYSFYIIFISMSLVGGLVHTLLERMGLEMKQREEELQGQILELRIEIDQMRRARQVQEVVESEGFQDLLQKAQAIREEGDSDS